MLQNNSCLFTLTLIFASLTWGKAVTAQPTRNIIVKGTLELQREGASRFVPASPYTELRLGDLIKPAPGASVEVLCEDGKIRSVQPGLTSGLNGICPSPRPRAPDSSQTVVPQRAGELTIPYIISPRATLLLSDKPILRWNDATGGKTFTVKVRGQGLNWTNPVSRAGVCIGNTCELVYSGPPLQQEVSYKLVVETDTNRSSAEETTGGLGFKLIDAAKATEVQTIARRIKQQDLSAQARAIALADLYGEYNLVAEAIASLEELVKNQKLASAYRRLGDLYLRIGLAREAEVQYLEAVKLPQEGIEIEELAAAKDGLSKVSLTLNRRNEAVRLLREALAGYEQLEDSQRVNELKERLRELTNAGKV